MSRVLQTEQPDRASRACWEVRRHTEVEEQPSAEQSTDQRTEQESGRTERSAEQQHAEWTSCTEPNTGTGCRRVLAWSGVYRAKLRNSEVGVDRADRAQIRHGRARGRAR